jgi:hypothetical protein
MRKIMQRRALETHQWSDGTTPHPINQDGRTILHFRCLRCGRDFAQGADQSAWQALYVGIFRVELIAESVSARWLADDCPGRLLESDQDDRGMRQSYSENHPGSQNVVCADEADTFSTHSGDPREDSGLRQEALDGPDASLGLRSVLKN